jgi:hypothetical protein
MVDAKQWTCPVQHPRRIHHIKDLAKTPLRCLWLKVGRVPSSKQGTYHTIVKALLSNLHMDSWQQKHGSPTSILASFAHFNSAWWLDWLVALKQPRSKVAHDTDTSW